MKYKVGDKVVMKIISADQDEIKTYSVSGVDNNWRWCLPQNLLERYTEPLSNYTEPLEDKIRRQTKEITRLLAENKELKEENKKLLCKVDSYELYGDHHEEEYNQAFNQGAEAAWELARKITCQPINGGFNRSEFEEIFGYSYISDIFEKYTYPEAAAKVETWEKAKDEIKVGDVLEDMASSKIKCVVTNIYPSNMAYLVFSDGSAGIHELENMKKTGRHIDIDGFLKQIRGEGDEK